MTGQETTILKRHRARRSWIVSAILALSAVQCGRTVSSSSGTETHWFEDCEVDADERSQCGTLSCVCGVCSLQCATDDDCSDAPEASECVVVNDPPDEGRCTADATSFCRPIALGNDREATTGANVSSTTRPVPPSTTGGGNAPDCDPIEDTFLYWCGTSACHGDPGRFNPAAPPYLFPSDPMTAFVDVPAVYPGCENELLINSMAPEKSLMLTSVTQTSPCGVDMPATGFFVDDETTACIEAWVYELAAMARGE